MMFPPYTSVVTKYSGSLIAACKGSTLSYFVSVTALSQPSYWHLLLCHPHWTPSLDPRIAELWRLYLCNSASNHPYNLRRIKELKICWSIQKPFEHHLLGDAHRFKDLLYASYSVLWLVFSVWRGMGKGQRWLFVFAYLAKKKFCVPSISPPDGGKSNLSAEPHCRTRGRQLSLTTGQKKYV